MSLIDQLSDGTWALEKALAYTEARQRVLAENIANVDTPGYRTKQLDTGAFQKALKEARAAHKQDPSHPLELPSTDEFHVGADGHLVVQPKEEPPENLLFHDQTNGRIERQMALLAENGMMHEVLTELLRGKYAAQLKAIKGQT